MKGTVQKKIVSISLPCCTCLNFRDEDPDIFYCELQKEEFPSLCNQYQQQAQIAEMRSEWTVPDEL